MTENDNVNRLLDSVIRCFTPEVIERVADFQIDQIVSNRIDELFRKTQARSITSEEQQELTTYYMVADFLFALRDRTKQHIRKRHVP